MKKKGIIRAALAVLLSAGIATGAGGCAKSKASSTAGSKSLFVIRKDTVNTFDDFEVGMDEGIFQKYGIAIEFTGELKTGMSEIQAVATGNIDVFKGHPCDAINAILGGAQIRIAGPGLVDNKDLPHMVYYVKQGSPIQSAADLKSRKVKVATTGLNICATFVFDKWLRDNNIPKSSIDYVVLPQPQVEQAITQGEVDIGVEHPPYIKQAANDGLKALITSWDIVQSPAGGAATNGFSTAFAAAHPRQITEFIEADNAVHKWINANQKEAVDLEAKRLGMDPKNMQPFYYDETGYVTQSTIQTWIDLMVADGAIKSGQIKASQVYTNKYNPTHTGA
jgi:ABC-type nitrate/sulfonate/bicarbonate transport systems, periplasmic components